MEQRELLVEEVGARPWIKRQREARGREALEERFGRYVGDVLEHPAVLHISVELGRADVELCPARPARARVCDADSQAAYVLTRLHPPAQPMLVIEAEELVAWLYSNGINTVVRDSDFKPVCRPLRHHESPIGIHFEWIRPIRKTRYGQRAKLAVLAV